MPSLMASGLGNSIQSILFTNVSMADKTHLYSNNKENSGNYRPVHFISVPGKMMKQLVLVAISKQLEEKKVMRSRGLGTRTGDVMESHCS